MIFQELVRGICYNLARVSVGSALALGLKPCGEPSVARCKENDATTKMFHGQCFEHQVHKPKDNYPAWDYDWDGNDKKRTGKTRHIILVRHGQYDQTFHEDHKRVLTALGRRQAEYTGKRLANFMAQKGSEKSGKEVDKEATACLFKSLHMSGMTRAIETAAIISEQLGSDVKLMKPDTLLNEALPAPIIPIRPDVGPLSVQAKEIEANREHVESAFQKYIHRSIDDDVEHEFEIIVCHANIIRYFLLRALQLPPEAWLRFSLFNCSLTYLMVQPNGYVTVRLVGDTGHIPYNETSFSGAHGYNWKTPTST